MATQRKLNYDVVVVGGGAAGVAAAVGARRRGARTLLVERYGFLGGEAASANVLSYCGFFKQARRRNRSSAASVRACWPAWRSSVLT